MLIIQNSAGGGTNLVNSGTTDKSIDLYALLNNDSFPVGTIMIFHGAKIPEKWVICDGKNGTPNLTGKFTKCVNTPAEANRGQTGGKANATLQNHTHGVLMNANSQHQHSLASFTFTTAAAGNHTHVQPNSPKYGGRSVCSNCGPTAHGSHKINQNVTRVQSSKAGNHNHSFNLPRTSTDYAGAHTHTTKTVTGGTTPKAGNNLPVHVKMIHIMKVR
jgi:hypothetical protein